MEIINIQNGYLQNFLKKKQFFTTFSPLILLQCGTSSASTSTTATIITEI